jgi:phenylpropionate dioxygenase-like ring-hydroxylating dioxygenase large terminal subunit
MEQLWAIFSTLWKNQRQKFHTVENIFPHRGKLLSQAAKKKFNAIDARDAKVRNRELL